MKITRPIDGEDLVIVYDLIEENKLDILKEFWLAKHYYKEDTSQEERLQLDSLPLESSIGLNYRAYGIIEEIKAASELVMRQEYPDLNLERFAYFDGISVRNSIKQPYMKPHVDGPPEYNNPEHGINNLGANFYLNSNFDGGEIYYPELNFTFKPVPNSLVIHRGTPLFLHGVAEVTSGWRLSFGMFAYEYFDAPPLQVGLDSDR
jgi:hypothetical protein